MKNRKLGCLSLLFILLLSLGAAQNSTNTEPSNETSVIAIDSSTKIVSADWSSDGVTLVFQSDLPRIATITDVNSMPMSGAGKVNFKQVQLASGKTTIQMQTTSRQGSMTVTIGVGNSLIAVSNPGKPLLQDVNTSNVYIGIISGAIWLLINLVSQHKYQIRKIRKHPRKIL
ncbi:MAG: hypothetical protein ABEJ95_01650 [Candidatus Nanohalobium sp.]